MPAGSSTSMSDSQRWQRVTRSGASSVAIGSLAVVDAGSIDTSSIGGIVHRDCSSAVVGVGVMVGFRSVWFALSAGPKGRTLMVPLWDSGHNCVRSKWTAESANTGHSYVRSSGTAESSCKPPKSSQRIESFSRHRKHSVDRWTLPKSATTNDQQQTAIGHTFDRTTNRSVTQTRPPWRCHFEPSWRYRLSCRDTTRTRQPIPAASNREA